MKGVIRQKRKLGPDGEWVYTQHYFLDGREVTEAEFKKALPPLKADGGLPAGHAAWKKPIHSDALGYHPDQVPEAREHLAKCGVPTDIDGEGRPILRSREHRRRVLKALQMHDRNSYTGH